MLHLGICNTKSASRQHTKAPPANLTDKSDTFLPEKNISGHSYFANSVYETSAGNPSAC